ncbi:MAG: peptidylprolyl isomerase, partial [Nitrospiraceae bacterium]
MMKKIQRAMHIGLVVAVLVGIAGVSLAADKDKAPAKAPRAIINTKFGEIEIEFFPDKAPKHVENFIKLAKS